MLRKHPEVREKGKGIDMSDLEQDEVVMFQKRFVCIANELVHVISVRDLCYDVVSETIIG